MKSEPTRRQWLIGTTVCATAGMTALAAEPKPQTEPFLYSLNTSTISGQKLPLTEEVDIAAKAGYHVIEPWIREIEQYVGSGGNLNDLRKRIEDKGLRVESSIGFFEWVVDDDAKRAKALETAKRNMDLVHQLGGKRIAAPPVGATTQTDLNLFKAAERYRALLEAGENIGVIPQVEVWGFSKSLHKLSETVLVAMECGHSKACVLPDVYHLYKGGTAFDAIKLLGKATMHVFHVNDYPAMPDRSQITDAHRIYPGDGVAPLRDLFRDLYRIGYRGTLSLELFNREYWKQDPFLVARTGLQKLRALVQSSLAGLA